MNARKNCTFNRETGLALVQSFYASGQKPRIFCENNNISYHILQYWKQIYKDINGQSQDGSFMPVQLAIHKNTNIKVVVNNNIVVEVDCNTDFHLFKQIISACRSCG